MKNIAWFVICVIFLANVFFAPGCQQMPGRGRTAAERQRTHQRVKETANQQIADDLDTIFLYDRPSRLSELRVR